MTREQQYFDALQRIAKHYCSAATILATADKRYGLEPSEALEMAYENLRDEARLAIKGHRRPKDRA